MKLTQKEKSATSSVRLFQSQDLKEFAMDRDDSSKKNKFSINWPASISATSSKTVIRQPHLATINEELPLQIRDKRNGAKGELDHNPNETTPLLFSMGAGSEESGSSMNSNTSKSNSISSQASSMFMTSLQLALNSSMVLISRSVSCSFRQSVTLSIQSLEESKTTTLIERLSDDARAPAKLALWNVLNVIISSNSVLGMPFAIALGGLAALPLTLLIGVLEGMTSVLLIDRLYEISPKSRLRKRVRASYSDIGRDVWGSIGGHIVDVIRIGLTYGSCVLRIMVLGHTMKELLSSKVDLSLQEWCLVCTAALLLVVFIKRLSSLAWLSMMAVLAAFLIFFVLLGFSLSRVKTWQWENLLFFDFNTFPISMGIIVYSYCGHPVFPAVEGSMKEPKRYNTISHWAFFLSTAMKFLVGLFCFLVFGSNTQSIVLLNLSASNASVLSKIASILVLINMYFSYPVNMFIVSGTIDILLLPKLPTCLREKKGFKPLWVLSSRVILVFSTLGIALAIPRFGLLMGVFGSVLGACITLIFPCIFHLKLKWNKLRWYHIAFEMFIIIFAAVVGVLGLIFSSIAIKKSLG